MNSRVRLNERASHCLRLTVLPILVIPKKYTVFRFEIPQPGSNQSSNEDEATKAERKDEPALVFELHGSRFENRADIRATHKFKPRIMDDL